MDKVDHIAPSKPPRPARLSFAELAGIRPADLARTASTTAATAPAPEPPRRRTLSAAARDGALALAQLVGLGGRPATPAPVPTTTTRNAASKPPTRPASSAGSAPGPTTGTGLLAPRLAPARVVTAAHPASARQHAEAEATARARGAAAGRAVDWVRWQAIYEAATTTRDPAELNLPVLGELASDPGMPVAQAAALLARLPAVRSARAHASAESARPDSGSAMRARWQAIHVAAARDLADPDLPALVAFASNPNVSMERAAAALASAHRRR